MTSHELSTLFLELEKSLLSKAVRNDREQLSSLLSDDFVEYGSSGEIYDKSVILDELERETTEMKIEITDLTAKELSPSIVLVTYMTTLQRDDRTNKRALRSSIWINQNNQWRIMFHQTTTAM